MTAVNVHALSVEAGHATLRGDWAGTGSPVVPLHAGICDRRMWDAEFATLAENHRVVRYDLRGFGDSVPSAATGDRPFSHHLDLLAVLDHLAIAQAVLVGASFGGLVAIDATLTMPDRVAALVTVCATSGGWPWDDVVRDVWSRVDDVLDRGALAEANELELRLWIDGPTRGPEAVSPEVRAWVGTMNAVSLAAAWRGTGEQPLDPPAADRLAEIRCPVLVIVGERDVPDVIAAGELVTDAVGRAAIARFPDAGHLPSLEDPKRFLRELELFLSHAEDVVKRRHPVVR